MSIDQSRRLFNLESCMDEIFSFLCPVEQFSCSMRLFKVGNKQMTIALGKLTTASTVALIAHRSGNSTRPLKCSNGEPPCVPFPTFVNLSIIKHARILLRHNEEFVNLLGTNWEKMPKTILPLSDVLSAQPMPSARHVEFVYTGDFRHICDSVTGPPTLTSLLPSRQSLVKLSLVSSGDNHCFGIAGMFPSLVDLTVLDSSQMAPRHTWPHTLTRLCIPSTTINQAGRGVNLPQTLETLECRCIQFHGDADYPPGLTDLTLHCPFHETSDCRLFYANLPCSITTLRAPFHQDWNMLRLVGESTSSCPCGDCSLAQIALNDASAGTCNDSFIWRVDLPRRIELSKSLRTVGFVIKIDDLVALSSFAYTQVTSLSIWLHAPMDGALVDALGCLKGLESLTIHPSYSLADHGTHSPVHVLPCTSSIRRLTIRLPPSSHRNNTVLRMAVVDNEKSTSCLETLTVDTMHLKLQNVRLELNKARSFKCVLVAGHLSSSLCIMDHRGYNTKSTFLPIAIVQGATAVLNRDAEPVMLYSRVEFTVSVPPTGETRPKDCPPLDVVKRGLLVNT